MSVDIWGGGNMPCRARKLEHARRFREGETCPAGLGRRRNNPMLNRQADIISKLT